MSGITAMVGSYTKQVSQNLLNGKSVSESFTKINGNAIKSAGAGGFVGGFTTGAIATSFADPSAAVVLISGVAGATVGAVVDGAIETHLNSNNQSESNSQVSSTPTQDGSAELGRSLTEVKPKKKLTGNALKYAKEMCGKRCK